MRVEGQVVQDLDQAEETTSSDRRPDGLARPAEPDISTLWRTGHVYFAETRLVEESAPLKALSADYDHPCCYDNDCSCCHNSHPPSSPPAALLNQGYYPMLQQAQTRIGKMLIVCCIVLLSPSAWAKVKRWEVEVSGLNFGAIAEVVVDGKEVHKTLVLETGRQAILVVSAGNYDITMDDVQLGDKIWTPVKKELKLKLTGGGKVIDRDTKRVLGTKKRLSLHYISAAAAPAATVAEPVYSFRNYADKGTYRINEHSQTYRCDSTVAGSCSSMFSSDIDGVFNAIAVGNNRVYEATNEGKIYSCDPDQQYSCTSLDDAGNNSINALIYANDRLYAGLSNGIIWSCDPNVPNSCSDFDNAGNNKVLSLTYGDGRLYAGLDSGILWSCDPNAANACSTIDHAAGPIQQLAYGNGRVYAGIQGDSGTLWSCDPVAVDSCIDLDKLGDKTGYKSNDYTSLIYANNQVFAGVRGGTSAYSGAFRCNPEMPDNCTTVWDSAQAVIEYGIYALQYVNGRLFLTNWYNTTVASVSTRQTDLVVCDPNLGYACSLFQHFP